MTLAERPARLKARVNDSAVVLILAFALSIGADGSNARSPQLYTLEMVTMFSVTGMGQYAPGSSSCADANAGSRSRAKAVSRKSVSVTFTLVDYCAAMAAASAASAIACLSASVIFTSPDWMVTFRILPVKRFAPCL